MLKEKKNEPHDTPHLKKPLRFKCTDMLHKSAWAAGVYCTSDETVKT